MTVSSTIREARTLCNGVTTLFAVPFQFIAPADMKVRLIDVATGGVVPLAEGVDYTVQGDGRAGTAQITTLVAFPAGKTLWRRRETASFQIAHYVPNDGFPALTHEQQLDRLTMVDQEQGSDVADVSSRALLVPSGETAAILPRADDRAGMLLGFDGTGRAVPVSAEDVEGRSAYQVWLDAGNVGSEADYLDSLQARVTAPAIVGALGFAPVGPIALGTKADRLPSNPYSMVIAGYGKVYGEWLNRWFNVSDNKLRPIYGIDSFRTGTPDDALARTSPWIWSGQIKVLYNEWRRLTKAGQTAAAAGVASNILGAWVAKKAQFTLPGDFVSTVYGTNQIAGLSDDASWFCMAMECVHRATGDASALSYLVEMIAATNVIFRDPHQTLVDTGVSTPGISGSAPIPFKYHPYGYLYTSASDAGGIATYGYASTSAELAAVLAALYVSQLPNSVYNSPIKAKFYAYAISTYGWWTTSMKVPSEAAQVARYGGSIAEKAKAGIYYSGFELDPASPDYLRGQKGYFTRPIRGIAAQGELAQMGMGCLAARLYQITGTASYLDEFKRITSVYTDPNAFGRTYNGVPVTNCVMDPWGSALLTFEYLDLLTQLTATGEFVLFKSIFLNTAKHIISVSADGYLPPDWGCPEWDKVHRTWTWEQANAINFGGNGGGGQSSRWQAPTCSNALIMIQAATQLVAFEAVYASNVAAPVSVEQMAAQIAALQSAMDRMQQITDIRWSEKAGTRFDPSDGGYILNYLDNAQVCYFHKGGSGFYGDLAISQGSLTTYGGLNARGGIGFIAGNDQFYIGTVAGGYGYTYGAAGAYSKYNSASGGYIETYLNDAQVMYLHTGGSGFYGNLSVVGTMNVSGDSYSLGLVNGARFNLNGTAGAFRVVSGEPRLYFATADYIRWEPGGAFSFYVNDTRLFRVDGNGNAQLRGTLSQSQPL